MPDARIFICYRRACDQARASHLHGVLKREFGDDEVFMDLRVPGGVNIREYITAQLQSCEVLLVVIGPRWLDVKDADGGRRLDNGDDYVRLEIETALRSSAKVVPVIVEKARMPAPRDLPPTLAGLGDLAEAEISDGRNWDGDVGWLVSTIREHLSPAQKAVPPPTLPPLVGLGGSGPPSTPPHTVRWLAAAGAVLLALVVGVLIFSGWFGSDDDRLRVYSSLPERDGRGNPSKRVGDMEKAMRLALKREHGRAGGREVVYEALDASDASGDTPTAIVEANARKAADDDRTAAYLGDFNSGDSQESIPILSEARIPQISPASTRTGLTAEDERGDLGEPEGYYANGYRNFVRVIPNDIVQAQALLELMLSTARPCTKLAVVDDASPYGRGLSNDILAYNNGRLQIKFRQSVDENGAYEYLVDQAAHRGVDCFVFSGVNREHTVEMFEEFADRLDGARLFGTDALADSAFYGSPDWTSDEHAGRVSIMVPPRSGTRYGEFRTAFVDEYDDEPELYAVYGYEAMLVALDAIKASGTARPEDIVDALFEMARRRSALGSYRFNGAGDTTLGRYAWSRIVDGELTTPRPTPRITSR